MTTWHHLVQSIPTLAYAAACVWSQDQAALGLRQTDGSLRAPRRPPSCASSFRPDGRFERAGWNTFELPAEVD